MKRFSEKNSLLWCGCIILAVITGAMNSVWTVYLLQKIVEAILQDRVHAPRLPIIFVLSVCAGAALEILLRKVRYVLYRRKAIHLEDRLISACAGHGEGGKEAFVLIQNTVDGLAAGRTDCVLECSGIMGLSVILGAYICSVSVRALFLCLAITGVSLCLMQRSSGNIPQASKLSNEKMNAVYGEMWNYLKCKEILPFLRPHVYGKYEEKLQENQQGQILLGRHTNTARICMRFGSIGTTLIAIVYFGMLTIQGRSTLPELLAITMLLPNLAENMLRIPNCIAQRKKLAGMQRNVDAFLESHGAMEDKGLEPLGERISSIHGSGIGYGYQEGKCHCRAEEISVQSGNALGICGGSGAGKTTLLRIVLGELQEYTGECLVNGRRVETLDRQEFWNHILYLSQNPVILPASLRENVTLKGRGEAIDEKKYIDSLRKAQIEELAAMSGDRELDGSALSSGEIQKVCLARCFYTDREVLILDEATNAMSPHAEKTVLQDLIDQAAQRNQLLILVSHNPAVIDLCDSSLRIQSDRTDFRQEHRI